MNAPINIALLAARSCMPAAPVRVQPLVPPDAQLLKSGYEHGALFLDLYGTLDDDGYEVTAVTLSGHAVNLEELITLAQLEDMSDWCDRHLPDVRQLQRLARQEARYERAEWDRLAR